MALQTYAQVRPYAAAIKEQTGTRRMPPFFADTCCQALANDPSLTADEIQTLAEWADAHAPAGDPRQGPAAMQWTSGWNISPPDAVLAAPAPVSLPAFGDIDYTYLVLPTHFREDRWIRMCEIRPSDRAVVHHAVAYIRPPNSPWLRGAPLNVPFTAKELKDSALRRDAMWTASDILLVYAPGSSPDRWDDGMAKLIPAGSDIVLQMHYTAAGHPASDRTGVGLVFASKPPAKRVMTLQLTNDRFLIPPGDPNHRVEVHGTLPREALLLSFFPHMHLRGKSFEYNIVPPGGKPKTLLRISHYDFHWQLSYRLADPLSLPAGTVLQAVASFDNSRGNAHNPDPDAAVSWGEQTWAEMMVGFFDVAVDPSLTKEEFFVRTHSR